MKSIRCLSIIILGVLSMRAAQAQDSPNEQLNKALDYFQSRKYHESVLLFEELNNQYALPSRYKAYLGVCYYYVWNYQKVIETLDPIINDIEIFPPHERSIYYYTDAESHFQLGRYKEAILLYEKMLIVCFPNERGDALYRLGFCYLNCNDSMNAMESFSSALAYYLAFPNNERKRQVKQLKHMIADLARNLQKE